MKKVLIVLLTLLMTLAISGCGENNEPADISQIPQVMMFEMYKN